MRTLLPKNIGETFLPVNHHIPIWLLENPNCLFIVWIRPNVWVIGVLKGDLRTLRGGFKRCFEGYFSYRAVPPAHPPTEKRAVAVKPIATLLCQIGFFISAMFTERQKGMADVTAFNIIFMPGFVFLSR
jgi:hypothetical protein